VAISWRLRGLRFAGFIEDIIVAINQDPDQDVVNEGVRSGEI
jgi:hypothetical protein